MKNNLKIVVSLIFSFLITIGISAFLKNPNSFDKKKLNMAKNFIINKLSPKIDSQLDKEKLMLTPKYKPKSNFYFLPVSLSPKKAITPKPKENFLPTKIINPTTPSVKISPLSFTPTPVKVFACKSSSSNSYSPIKVLTKNSKDINDRDDIILPPLTPVKAKMELFYAPVADPDPKIPALKEIFSPPRLPTFLAGYQSTKEIRGDYIAEVEILEVETIPGEALYFPHTDYDIGEGFKAMVLYVSENAVTFKISREDDIVYGYTLYFENLCPDTNLKALYDRLNNQNRDWLPAIKEGQIFGWARGESLKIALRDSGTFLDLRQIDSNTGLGFWR